MQQRRQIRKKLAVIGGFLIIASGIVNAALGMSIGAIYYEVFPGGNMGHVGIIAGIAATIMGILIVCIVVPLYNRHERLYVALAGILTVVLGHLGAIAGAIYIGTLGLLLCYVAGFWTLIVALIKAEDLKEPPTVS